jgi:hypothetical protein
MNLNGQRVRVTTVVVWVFSCSRRRRRVARLLLARLASRQRDLIVESTVSDARETWYIYIPFSIQTHSRPRWRCWRYSFEPKVRHPRLERSPHELDSVGRSVRSPRRSSDIARRSRSSVRPLPKR